MAGAVSLTSRGEGVSLALIGQPSSDGVTIKTLYEVDVLLPTILDHTDHPRTPSFHTELVKTESDFIVISVDNG